MSNTPNLDLELIESTDNVKTTFLDKINNNYVKIDTNYNEIKEQIIEAVGATNLEDAITEINNYENTIATLNSLGDASPEDIRPGKTALVKGELITGDMAMDNVVPKVNVTLTGDNATYVGYISGYWAAINERGELIISAMSNTTAYESIYFIATSIGVGIAGSGFGISSHDTGNQVNRPMSCIVTDIDISKYTNIDITLNASTVNSSYDYVALQVTVVGS